MALIDEIRKDSQTCFKRIYMKRRISSYPYYEADWQEITDYVFDVAEITYNIDDENLNEFTQGDFSLTIDNSLQKFTSENNVNSLFYGYLTRHKTMITVYAGYTDTATGVEYGYYIASGYVNAEDIAMDNDGLITMPVLAPTMALDELSASMINRGVYPGGITSGTTAFHLIDAGGNFDIGMEGLEVTNITDNVKATVMNYVSPTDLLLDTDVFTIGETYNFGQTRWYCNQTISSMVQRIYDIQKDGEYAMRPFYNTLTNVPANDLTLEVYDFSEWSCREALTRMAEASNSAYWVTPALTLKFVTKAPGASVFTFNNTGEDVNILSATGYNEGIKNLITRVVFSDTDPMIYADENMWSVDATSATWKYGQKEYSVDNRLIRSSTLQRTICDNILGANVIPKEEIELITKFIPQLQLLDHVTVNCFGLPMKQVPTLWWKNYWKKGLWDTRYGGIQLQNASMKIMKITHNVMEFTSQFKLRRI